MLNIKIQISSKSNHFRLVFYSHATHLIFDIVNFWKRVMAEWFNFPNGFFYKRQKVSQWGQTKLVSITCTQNENIYGWSQDFRT